MRRWCWHFHGRLRGAISWRGRRSASRDICCVDADLWSRKGAGGDDVHRGVAAHVCILQPGGIAAAVPRRMVHGRFAQDGDGCGAGSRIGGGRNCTRCACSETGRRNAVKCPFCTNLDDEVVDSREARTGDLIRRRRECLKCSRRFTTYERIDEIPYMVIKKDGRREKFERAKLLQGLLKACEKRPVPVGKLEMIVDEAEQFVSEAPERERTMQKLKKLDKVAYVRFASVYLDFKDVKEFMDELKVLLKDRVKK